MYSRNNHSHQPQVQRYPLNNSNRRLPQKKTKAAPDDNASDRLVIAVDKLTSEIAARNQKQGDTKSGNAPSANDGIKLTDWLVAIFTGFLTVFAFLQSRWMKTQAGYMRDGLALTRETAKAATKSAEISERALIATQRALLVHTQLIQTLKMADDGRTIIGFEVTPAFENRGPTPALNAQCFIELFVLDHNAVAHTSFDPSKRVQVSGSTIGPNVRVTGERIPFVNEHIDQLLRKEIAIFIHAYAEYRDVFEGTPLRKTSVCCRMVLDGDPRTDNGAGFNAKEFGFPAGPPEHNYAT